ncbi:MAG: LysR substrate-binding domain-containing protein [Rhodovibrionaceae bacterium]
MPFTQLRAFNAVAEYGSFTEAAKRLNVSQSTVTLQVRELEARYNVELFHRHGRSTTATDFGIALFAITKRLILAQNEAEEFLQASKMLETGKLRLAAVGPFHAAEIASAFKLRYPGVEVAMTFGNSQRTLDAVTELHSDVAILAEVDEQPGVSMDRYSRHNVVVFVHKGHRFFDRKSIRIGELVDQRFILREEGSTTRRAMEKALTEHGVEVDRVMEIGSREGVWKAVKLGLGIGVVADFEFVPAPDLRAIPFSDAEVTTNYFIAYLTERQNAPIVKAFRELALQKPP